MIVIYFLAMAVSIIYGGRSRNKVLGQKEITCSRCQRPSYHAVVRTRRWFTLYFIPLIPMYKRTIIRCNLCGFQSQIDNSQADAWFPQGQTAGAVSAPAMQPQVGMPQPQMGNPPVGNSPVAPQQSAQQLVAQGNSLYSAGRYPEAVSAYDQAIRVAPNDASAYFYKGNVLAAMRNYEAALATYDGAIHLAPNVADAYNAKGRVLEQLGRSEEAQKAYADGRVYGYRG